MNGISERLVDFALATVASDIPDDVLSVFQLSFLDWLAVGTAGAQEPVACGLRALAQSESGTAEAAVFGDTTRFPARMAAMVNGTTSHALDYDDTHFAHIGHPSVAVISAALAVAQARGASGKDMQIAALVGMEASVRTGVWLGRGHYQSGFHQTATAGAFGAGLAAARLMNLDAAQTAMTLGLLATRASGLKAQFGTMAKPFNAGIAAANGVEAATLISLGLDANPTALDGPLGFGETHHGSAQTGAFDDLGHGWIFAAVSHKFHACCHGLHAALEAARALEVPSETIETITVATHPRWMTVCNQPEPETGLGAKFSYKAVLALHFLGLDTARLETFSDANACRKDVKQFLSRVTVIADATLAETATRLSVTLADGSMVETAHDLLAPLGLPERQAKVLGKAAALLGSDRAESFWKRVVGMSAPNGFLE